MSNVPPRSARSSILGKSLRANTRFAHTDPLRNALQHRVQKEKPLPHGVQNGLFRYRYSVLVPFGPRCQTLYTSGTNPQNLHPHHSQVNR